MAIFDKKAIISLTLVLPFNPLEGSCS